MVLDPKMPASDIGLVIADGFLQATLHFLVMPVCLEELSIDRGAMPADAGVVGGAPLGSERARSDFIATTSPRTTSHPCVYAHKQARVVLVIRSSGAVEWISLFTETRAFHQAHHKNAPRIAASAHAPNREARRR